MRMKRFFNARLRTSVAIAERAPKPKGPRVRLDCAGPSPALPPQLCLEREAVVTVEPAAQLRVVASGPVDTESMARLLSQPGAVAFIPVQSERLWEMAVGEPLPVDMAGAPWLFGGERVVSASSGLDEELGFHTLSLGLDEDGARRLDEHAAGHVGEELAILVDGRLFAAPVLSSASYEGQVQITGEFEDATLASVVAFLLSGPLPLPLAPIKVSTKPSTVHLGAR